MDEKQYCVYILTNKRHTVLYVGFTSDISARMEAHKGKLVKGFTARYNVDQLVYVEVTEDRDGALTREKQLKNWHRQWKWELIKKHNPTLRDLTDTLV